MAESIYTQLANQTILTPVDGKEYRHNLPEGLFPDDKTFESPELLIAWANENNFTHKLLQKGLQKGIIDVRAIFKSCPKDKTWSEEMGNKNLEDLEWKSVDRPNQSDSKKLDKARFGDCMAMIVTLTENGMDKETIQSMTLPIYGEDIVNAIFDSLTVK